MLKYLDSFFEYKSNVYITSLCLIFICVLGILDQLNGYEMSFSIFYILPISIGSWYAERKSGFILCYFSAVISLVVDYTSRHMYSDQSILYWNALIRACYFVLISHLTSTVKYNYAIEKELARIDSLTGVMNLRAFKEISDALFKVASRSKCAISICYIDVDDFKVLNDTYGHDEGDRALCTIANTLKNYVRKSDSIGRLGGDEFAILLYDTNMAGAKMFTDRILKQLNVETKYYKSPIGFSIGVSFFSVTPSSSHEAIKFADTLMYRAKKSGGNQIVYGDFAQSDEIPDSLVPEQDVGTS
jgi:diguanylate cyclase (GGDEF)-like protein